MKQVHINNLSQGLASPLAAQLCERFICKLIGLSWRSSLGSDRALIIAGKTESRMGSSIHMLGMFFDLGIVWLNSEMEVVDLRQAFRWRSFLLPAKFAQYVIELPIERLEEFAIGDRIKFETHS